MSCYKHRTEVILAAGELKTGLGQWQNAMTIIAKSFEKVEGSAMGWWFKGDENDMEAVERTADKLATGGVFVFSATIRGSSVRGPCCLHRRTRSS